jgi:hypothetical protein
MLLTGGCLTLLLQRRLIADRAASHTGSGRRLA